MRGKVKFLLTRTKPSLFIKPLLHPKYFKFSSVLQQLNRRGMFSIYHIFYIYRSLMVSVSIYICKYIDSCKVAIHITSVFVIWFFFLAMSRTSLHSLIQVKTLFWGKGNVIIFTEITCLAGIRGQLACDCLCQSVNRMNQCDLLPQTYKWLGAWHIKKCVFVYNYHSSAVCKSKHCKCF